MEIKLFSYKINVFQLMWSDSAALVLFCIPKSHNLQLYAITSTLMSSLPATYLRAILKCVVSVSMCLLRALLVSEANVV